MAKKKQNLPDNAGLQYGYAKQDNVRRMTVLPTSELRTNNLSLNPVDDFAKSLGLKPDDTTNKPIPPISTPNPTFERMWTEGDDDRMDVSGERILPPKETETTYTPPTPNYDPTNGVPDYLPKGLNPILWDLYKPDAFRDNAEEPKTNTGLTTSDPWNQRMDELYAQLANLEPPRIGDFKGPTFNYDYRDDPSYQQYRQQYVRNGQLAMQDTMGQAAGLTGGYGSSYSQNVGQQAYQGYMNQLNAVVPELYQNAYNRYLNDYSNQYNEWRDKYSAELDAYKAQLSGLGNQYDIARTERAYEDAKNTPATTDYEALAKLRNAGLWFDENGNVVPMAQTPSESDKLKAKQEGFVYDSNGNLVRDESNIDGMTGEDIMYFVEDLLANNKKVKKAKTTEEKIKAMLDWAVEQGWTAEQKRYLRDIARDYLN